MTGIRLLPQNYGQFAAGGAGRDAAAWMNPFFPELFEADKRPRTPCRQPFRPLGE